MSQNTSTRGLIIVTVLLTLIITLGVLFYQEKETDYEMTTAQALEALAQDFTFLPLEKARELTAASDYRFVDIRNAGEFSKGHLPQAIHIPLHRLLDATTIAQFKETSTVHVLYGSDISEGAAACALLRQVGLTNVQALQGCYTTYTSGAPSPVVEAAAYDYRKVFEEVGVAERGNLSAPPPAETAPKVILPVKRVTKPVSEGC